MDKKPIVPKKVTPEKIYLRCSQGGFWFLTRNHTADTEYILANKQMDKLINDLIKVKDAADNKVALFSNQGQGMDGFSELANYRDIIEKIQEQLNDKSK